MRLEVPHVDRLLPGRALRCWKPAENSRPLPAPGWGSPCAQQQRFKRT